MWILLAVASALCLGVYDIFKKLSLNGNNVLTVLFFNTAFGALLMSPVIIEGLINGSLGLGETSMGHFHILIKSFIVLSSWLCGYFGLKHLPLTIAGPINATRPVMVLIGAMLIFGERLNLLQWGGVILGISSLYLISRIGRKEGISIKHNRWLWLSFGAMVMGAVSGLYDKYLLRQYDPLEVQAWYSFYQFVIMGITIAIIKRVKRDTTPFQWRWTIPCIALFLTIADIAYFYSLSLDDSLIAVVSMIRRGSVIVSFLFGVIMLHEKNVKLKIIDLSILLVGLILLVIGSN
ncbi:MAG: EamA family transporter [Muribaculaceae bacterium]|nr:EamA family transporter [Muribaculaceae bacterium]